MEILSLCAYMRIAIVSLNFYFDIELEIYKAVNWIGIQRCKRMERHTINIFSNYYT